MTIDTRQIGLNCMALKARMAARTVTRAYDAALKPLNLRITQFTLLACIASDNVKSISALADYLAVERTTLTRNLQLLEKNGFIEFSTESSGRAKPILLTQKGEELLQKAIPIWEGVQDTLQEKLGNNEWHMVASSLGLLTKSV
ncbi:MarR family transcriptional regulator [Sneathiella sp. P13V-1]|uniref:MarR family winged helix-turn-helix transcriptional regulator n=1 Tax=Sneathiella sp. P13V-1 TaxID=2697366 RepID=UPI00187B78BE|nr:MarR family transcriptional regulator [Sneathiella sp. P13V-1]MBE7637732.1 MarR family transcriptional regulator [Sneathiella sp. P13V-1]